MPFGICSAPEVFQRRMDELIEGLHGMEVVADDFAAVGFGETLEEATLDHDKNLKAFLERCEEKNIKLNAEKLKPPRWIPLPLQPPRSVLQQSR